METQMLLSYIENKTLMHGKEWFNYNVYRLLDSLVVECWLRVREVPGSISSQGPRHTKVRSRRSLAVVAGVKKTNDKTNKKSNAKKNTKNYNVCGDISELP